MNNEYAILEKIITHRRSVKPSNFTGKQIDAADIDKLLQLADQAPNHGSTEPWLFKIYTGQSLENFCLQHADLYKQHASDSFMQSKYDKLRDMGNKASHLIIAVMQRGNLPKIPVWEELAAASCAVQNMLLGAESLGIAGFWSTGGMTSSDALKQHLKLREEDMVIGLLYFGYAENSSYTKQRNRPLSTKITYITN